MMTPEQVAKHYGCTKEAVMRRVRTHELPHYRICGRVRFLRSELPVELPDRRKRREP